MRLYYFTSEQRGLEAIRDNRLKVARIAELNDPMEFLAPIAETAEERTKFQSGKALFDRKAGIVCFSTRWSHPLMWAHYADKHRGVALGFEVPAGEPFFKVHYRKDRPRPEEFGVRSFDDMSREQISEMYDKVVRQKFSGWCYEEEWRMFSTLDFQSDPTSDIYFQKFREKDFEMKLTEVIVGSRCPLTKCKLARVLGASALGVQIIKAGASHDTFDVVVDESAVAWD